MSFGSEITDIGAGNYNSLLMTVDGCVNTWGNNQYGLAGNGTVGGQYNAPNLISTFSNGIVQTGDGRHIVSSNYGESAAIDASGQLWMWGLNSSGQLGDGTTAAHYSPQPVLSSPNVRLTGVISVAAGSSHTVALRSDGTVWNWGTGLNGRFRQRVDRWFYLSRPSIDCPWSTIDQRGTNRSWRVALYRGR